MCSVFRILCVLFVSVYAGMCMPIDTQETSRPPKDVSIEWTAG